MLDLYIEKAAQGNVDALSELTRCAEIADSFKQIQSERDALLHACRAMWAGVSDHTRDALDLLDENKPMAIPVLPGSLKLLRAAIAKATGSEA